MAGASGAELEAEAERQRRLDRLGGDVAGRTVALVGAIGHGKTALVSAAVAAAGTPAPASAAPTLRSAITEVQLHGLRLVLADTPGHPDLREDADSLLRLCDGAVVAVDAIEGVLSATEAVIRAARAARTRAILALTKVDRLFTDKAEDEVVYKTLAAAVGQVNAAAVAAGAAAAPPPFPIESTLFSSGSHGWGFTLDTFARIYAEKFGVDPEKLVTRLWGDSFYDAQSRRWVSRADDRLVRERKAFRTSWTGWLLRENAAEMRWQRYYYVLEKDNLSWYSAPSHYGKMDPGPRGMLTITEWSFDTTHQLLAEIEVPHAFALLPAGWSSEEEEDGAFEEEGGRQGPQPLVLAAESAAAAEALGAKWAANAEFLRRRELRLNGGLDDQLPRRAFNQFVLEPLRAVCTAALREQRPRLVARLAKLGCTLTDAQLQLRSTALLRAALGTWLPLGKAIADGARANLPDAEVAAGVDRGESLDGSEAARLVLDRLVPLPAGLSVPTDDSGRFVALGRVFAGTAKRGMSLRCADHATPARVTGLWRWTGGEPLAESLDAAPQGSMVLVAAAGGVERALPACATTFVDADGAADQVMKGAQDAAVAEPRAVICVEISPASSATAEDEQQLALLVQRAVLASPGTVHRAPPKGEGRATRAHEVGVGGELAMHLWLQAFRRSCAGAGLAIEVGEAYVPLRESVAAKGRAVVATSPDRRHWVTLTAAPLPSAAFAALRKAKAVAGGSADGAQLDEALTLACGERVKAEKRFLLAGAGTNVFTDARISSSGAEAAAFAAVLEDCPVLSDGILCGEPLDGVMLQLRQYKLLDGELALSEVESDAEQTEPEPDGSGAEQQQLAAAVERGVRAACVAAGLCLREPLFRAEVVCGSEDDTVGAYRVLSARGGSITHERQHPYSPTYYIQARVPVARAFGLTAQLGAETAGSATVQCCARGDDWQRVAGGAQAEGVYVSEARRRHGWAAAAELPSLASLTDQMTAEEAEEASGPSYTLGGGGGGGAASAWGAPAPAPGTPASDADFEPEPEPMGDNGGATEGSRPPRRADPRRLKAPRRNEHREAEVKEWIVEAQRLEDKGQMMAAMRLWKKAFKVCPQLEEASYISRDKGESWEKI